MIIISMKPPTFTLPFIEISPISGSTLSTPLPGFMLPSQTVKDIRVERLQDITNEDAKSEGIDIGAIDDEKYQKNVAYRMLADNLPKARFGDLWDSINKARGYGWDTNPWVWVIEFEKKEGGM